ncbi:hypothetical protein IP88_02070 [alpha proteobacterium AAP81b]|nr:hypothetical protein IP88_02070 [alpha proteobacterium AAP81b]
MLPETEELAQLRKAFRVAFPIYEVMRTRALQLGKAQEASGVANLVNFILPRLTLADATSREITTPNNDTLYGSAWLDLAGGPVILTVPSLGQRYNSAALMSLTTDNIAILGTRSGAGRYALVGPGYNGPTPDGTQLVRMPTNDAWLLIRVLVTDRDDVAAAAAALREFKLESLPDNKPAVPVANAAPANPDARTFLAVVNEAIERSQDNAALIARTHAFYKQGMTGPESAFSPETLALWEQALPQFRAELKGGLAAAGDVIEGWNYPKAGVGDFGEDDDLRSLIALGGLAALPRIEAVYLSARTDAAGAPLDGSKSWRVRIPAKPPVGAFWSLTMYEADKDGRLFFVANDLDRFAVSSQSQHLRAERDGSYEIFVQASRPTGERVVNWLPAPKGRFVLVWRGYLPGQSLLDGSFRLPPVAEGELIP